MVAQILSQRPYLKPSSFLFLSLYQSPLPPSQWAPRLGVAPACWLQAAVPWGKATTLWQVTNYAAEDYDEDHDDDDDNNDSNDDDDDEYDGDNDDDDYDDDEDEDDDNDNDVTSYTYILV